MRFLIRAGLALAVLAVIGVGIHVGLVGMTDGEGDWAARAAATCAMCHTGG